MGEGRVVEVVFVAETFPRRKVESCVVSRDESYGAIQNKQPTAT